MILCGGDSFGTFLTPVDFKRENCIKGASFTEQLAERYNTYAISCGAEGQSIDFTATAAIETLEKVKNIKLCIFYISQPARLMIQREPDKGITTYFDYHPNQFNWYPSYCIFSEPPDKIMNSPALSFLQAVPRYKKYYDPFAYISLLSSFCIAKKIPLLLMNEIHRSEHIQEKFKQYDEETHNKIYGDKKYVRLVEGPIHTPRISAPGNHLYKEQHTQILEKVLLDHAEIIEGAIK